MTSEDIDIGGYHIPAKVGSFFFSFDFVHSHEHNITDTSDVSHIHCMSRPKVC